MPYLPLLIYVAKPKIPQSNRDIKRQVAPERLLRTHSTFDKSVTVSMNVFIESWGYVGYLIFVDVGVKINGAYHSEVSFLTQKLLPVMCEIYGEFFIFQQGNAAAHRAGETTFWD